MSVLITFLYFLITIGILVLIHELGHFLAAKLFGMRVETFSIGFPPRAFGKRIGETDYCISWIPIGGYVKIAGMIDESLDTDFLKHEPQSWEFRAKPKWQQAVVLTAGVAMNVLLAIMIFWGIIYFKGITTHTVNEIGYVIPESPAQKANLQIGDKIISINKHPVEHWDEIQYLIYVESAFSDLQLEIERNGAKHTLNIPRTEIPDISEQLFGLYPTNTLAVIKAVEHNMPAEKIGLMPSDTILAINGKPMTFGLLQETIKANAGKEILIEWARGNQKMSARVTPTEKGLIGVHLYLAYCGPKNIQKFSFLSAFPVGIQELKKSCILFFINIYKLLSGKASFSRSVGGPIAIAVMAKESAEEGIMSFLGLLALLSISLAILNILPFPALDGGHLLFISFEAIFKKEIPPKIKIIIQQIGFAILLIFMAIVIINDLLRF